MNRWLHRVAAVAAVAAGSTIFASAPAAAAPAVGAAACAFTPTSIAIVVDFGEGSPVSSVCVPVDSTDSGLSVLAARADQLGTPAPRFSSSGLLCAIDGEPRDGCGEQTGSRYAYWSYWHGSSGVWSYSSVGPSSRARATTVEGWRFQAQGAGNPSDPPPRGSADPATTCAPAPAPAPPASTSTSTAAAPTSGRGEATPQSTTTTSPTDDATAEPESTTVVSSSSFSTSTASNAAQAAAPAPITTRDRRGGPVLGMLAGGGLVVALGVAGAVVARRRGATDP